MISAYWIHHLTAFEGQKLKLQTQHYPYSHFYCKSDVMEKYINTGR